MKTFNLGNRVYHISTGEGGGLGTVVKLFDSADHSIGIDWDINSDIGIMTAQKTLPYVVHYIDNIRLAENELANYDPAQAGDRDDDI